VFAYHRDVVGAKFYCPRGLPDSSQIREKMLELQCYFISIPPMAVLSTVVKISVDLRPKIIPCPHSDLSHFTLYLYLSLSSQVATVHTVSCA